MEAILAIIFIIGYLAIALEHPLNLNKAAPAILTGVLCWTIYIIFSSDVELVNHQLEEHLSEISGILFFLLGAMTIVELIDAHHGFDVITSRITTKDKRKLLWIISIITFFLSAVLDNLTTAIVMTSLTRKLVSNRQDKLLIVGMVVIAANAGGAWSPIGDVTTTMLWIGGQITATNIMAKLLIPSLICLLVPLLMLSKKVKGEVSINKNDPDKKAVSAKESNLVFFVGIGALIMVPVFKTITHLPPYLGILLGLGIMWVITEFLHKSKEGQHKSQLSVTRALEKIDTSSILFFLGILVSVACLQSVGILKDVALWLDHKVGDLNLIVVILGLLSSVIDNVPLVAAAMGMYDLSTFPTDHYLWEFLAYCCGTGGSCLIIGSAAGVAAMGIEKIEFFWYVRNITFYALAGYLAGAACYILMEPLFM